MHPGRHGVIAALLALLSCSDSEVLAQVYLEGRAGLSASSNVTVRSAGNDRSSVCDEYINPRAPQLAACTTISRGRGGGWQARYDGGVGRWAGVEVGYRWSGAWRVALSASRGEIDFDQTVSSTNATGEFFEKLSNELAVGRVRQDRTRRSARRRHPEPAGHLPDEVCERLHLSRRCLATDRPAPGETSNRRRGSGGNCSPTTPYDPASTEFAVLPLTGRRRSRTVWVARLSRK